MDPRRKSCSKAYYGEHEDAIKLCKASKRAFDLSGKSGRAFRHGKYQKCAAARAPAGRKISAVRCAAEDEIFDHWGLHQQAKTESSASGRNLFVLSLSDREGIACYGISFLNTTVNAPHFSKYGRKSSGTISIRFLKKPRLFVYNVFCWIISSRRFDMNGIKGDISRREASYRWGVSERRVNQYCAEGRIPGASRFGRSRAIPEDAKKPSDPRKANTNRMSRRRTPCQNRNGT